MESTDPKVSEMTLLQEGHEKKKSSRTIRGYALECFVRDELRYPARSRICYLCQARTTQCNELVSWLLALFYCRNRAFTQDIWYAKKQNLAVEYNKQLLILDGHEKQSSRWIQ